MFPCLETLLAAASRKKRPQGLELALELGPSLEAIAWPKVLAEIQMLVEHLTR